jgi:hypothetical protein
VCDAAEEDMEKKETESDEVKKKHLCLHLERQLLALRLFDDIPVCDPSKQIMSAFHSTNMPNKTEFSLGLL